jgi:hypothetical protein
LDTDYVSHLPEKRPTREKRKPSEFDEIESKPRQGDAVKRIFKVIHTLKKSPYAQPFLKAVDLVAHPDYLQVVSEPMDLETVETKLKHNEYETAYQFAMDIRKIWSNSFRYSAKGSDLYSMTMEISALFEKLIEGKDHLVLNDKKDALHDLYRQVERMSKEIKDLHAREAVKVVTKSLNDKPMTLQEKRVLGQNIRKLEPKDLRGVLDIVRDCMSIDADGEALVIDLGTLPPKLCRELEQYLKNLHSKASNKLRISDLVPSNPLMDEAAVKRHKEAESELDQIADPLKLESKSSSSDDSLEEEMPAPCSPLESLPGLSVSSLWSPFQEEPTQPTKDPTEAREPPT